MRAIQITEWTLPGRLRSSEIDAPTCGDHEVLVRVHAAAISHSLSLLVQGRYQRKPSFPFVPGNTVAGVVEAVGKLAARYRVGDRVLASLEHGGLAELAVAHEDNVYAIPSDLPFAEATTFNSSYNSVAAALTWPHLLALQPGQSLLVTGAAGNVGTAAVQVGCLLGATVIAAASNAAKRAHAIGHGAHAAVDSDPQLLRRAANEAAQRMTGRPGVDAALDPVGGDVFDAALRCLSPGGRILPIGFASGVIPQIPANLLLVKNVTVCGLYMGYYKIDARPRHADRMRALFAMLADWWKLGQIKPVIAATFRIDRIAEAFEQVLDRAGTGHIVVNMQ